MHLLKSCNSYTKPEMYFFQDIYDQIAEDMPRRSTTRDIFQHLWNIKDLERYQNWFPSPTNSKVEKSNKISEECRKEGNEEFRQGNITKALEKYIKGIMFAENAQKFLESGNALSLAYSNCSAALFDLKFYDECIFCIEKALNFGYPSLLKYKLILRLAKCYVALNKVKNAKSTLITYLDEIKHMSKQQKMALETSRVQLQNLLSECENGNIVTNKSAATKAFRRDSQDISITDPNPNIPSASSAVSIQFSNSRGRHLCATRNIAPGE